MNITPENRKKQEELAQEYYRSSKYDHLWFSFFEFFFSGDRDPSQVSRVARNWLKKKRTNECQLVDGGQQISVLHLYEQKEIDLH